MAAARWLDLVHEAAEDEVDQAAMARAAARLEAERQELAGDLEALKRRRQRRARGG
jgi:predicted ATP-grasp superfamily ATP-dependent carboligase